MMRLLILFSCVSIAACQFSDGIKGNPYLLSDATLKEFYLACQEKFFAKFPDNKKVVIHDGSHHISHVPVTVEYRAKASVYEGNEVILKRNMVCFGFHDNTNFTKIYARYAREDESPFNENYHGKSTSEGTSTLDYINHQ